MDKQTYNGWTNYETWLVNLWIDNAEWSQSYWRARATIARDKWSTERLYGEDSYTDAEIKLSEEIKLYHENDKNDLDMPSGSGQWVDMINAALSQVEWREIAKSIIDSLE